jgi:hypothetical protein
MPVDAYMPRRNGQVSWTSYTMASNSAQELFMAIVTAAVTQLLHGEKHREATRSGRPDLRVILTRGLQNT